MGCCESTEERGNVHMSTVPHAKIMKMGNAYNDQFKNDSFDTEADTHDQVDYDLYSDFSDDSRSDDGEESDWDELTENATLERLGYCKELFKSKPLKVILKHTHFSIRNIFNEIGPFKVKPTDIPSELKDDNLEFRCEAKNLGPDGFYLGQWRSDTNTREGRGILVNAKKEIYEGFWFNGKQSGMGRFINLEGDVYQGMWKNGTPEGKGILKNSEGMIYKGSWVRFTPHGMGYEVWKDGTCYLGEFKRGSKSREGHYRWIDDSEYKGEVKNDKLH